MTTLLSASAIKDFISCSQRYKYRRYAKTKAEETTAMTIGSIVHSVVEEYWDATLEEAQERAHVLRVEAKLYDAQSTDKIERNITNFFTGVKFPLSQRDKIEKFFKVPYDPDTYIIGKFDRIVEDSVVIDWKTGGLPFRMYSDPQFVVYDWAFEKIYGYPASSIIAMSLDKNYSHTYRRKEPEFSLLMYEVIPAILERIENEKYAHEGRFQYMNVCNNCPYLKHCNNELASRNPIKR
jgi:RecB family exonuclease